MNNDCLLPIFSLFSVTSPSRLPAETATMASNQLNLTADYASPSGTHTFSHTLPSASAKNVTEKTAYLSAVRSKNAELQNEINAFLTQKMEEDVKAAEGSAGQRIKKEEREEEMYGEEDPEADD